jgi:predicted TIM-barrel fold metal-dependent hydrolase
MGAQDVLEMLEEYQIDRAVVFPDISGLSGAPAKVAEANEFVAGAVTAFPEKLVGFATANPAHGGEGLEELKRAVNELGLSGLKLHPAPQGFAISNRTQVDPFFEMASRLGVPVVIHAGRSHAGIAYVTLNLFEVKTLADAFPQVTIILAHMGWGGRDCIGIDVLAAECPNVWFDTSGVNDEKLIRQVVKQAGADRVMYGSDFPRLHPRVEMLKVEMAGLGEEDEKKVMGVTAMKLLERGTRTGGLVEG